MTARAFAGSPQTIKQYPWSNLGRSLSRPRRSTFGNGRLEVPTRPGAMNSQAKAYRLKGFEAPTELHAA
jgi:hypothetical protein